MSSLSFVGVREDERTPKGEIMGCGTRKEEM
jgi:hypothetical protein